MVPFWIPIIRRHLIFRVPKNGTMILTTTHMGYIGCTLFPYSLKRTSKMRVWLGLSKSLLLDSDSRMVPHLESKKVRALRKTST